jgi:hypothetical protein
MKKGKNKTGVVKVVGSEANHSKSGKVVEEVRGDTNHGSGDGPTIGIRAKVETPSSFNIGGREIIIPVSVEATGGIRLKLKMPKIFQ